MTNANKTAAAATKFIVQTAKATMPSSCRFGEYRRVAVLEVLAHMDRAAMISERARGVVQVAATWEKCSVGKTDRCAYARALADAEEVAARLNRENDAKARRRARYAERKAIANAPAALEAFDAVI